MKVVRIDIRKNIGSFDSVINPFKQKPRSVQQAHKQLDEGKFTKALLGLTLSSQRQSVTIESEETWTNCTAKSTLLSAKEV